MTSQAEMFCRDRRLYDVRRGVVYLRRTDDLAQRQWRHYGTVPAIKTHVIRDIGVTTRLTDVTDSQYDAFADRSPTDARGSESDVRNSTSDIRASISEAASVDQKRGVSGNKNFVCKTTVLEESSSYYPQISLTEVQERNPNLSSPQAVSIKIPPVVSSKQNAADSSTNSGDPNTSASTPQGTVPMSWADSADLSSDLREIHNSPAAVAHFIPSSKDLKHSQRESHNFQGHPEDAPFDTWGSRDWEVDRKLEPDTQPKSYAPKHYPPMSRAAGAEKGEGLGKRGARRRQLRTLTDFRSRNGTVRIIRPLPAITDAKKVPVPSAPEQDDDFDVDTLDREKTYAMLKRIDRLLDPTKAYFTSDLASSQQEVISSTPSASDLTESLSEGDERHYNRGEHFQGQSGRLNASDDHVQVHKEHFHKYFQDFSGQDDQFRGHNFHPSQGQPGYSHGQRSNARNNSFRGHSEPPRGHSDHPLREHHYPATTQNESFYEHTLGGLRDQDSGRYYFHHSRMQPGHQGPRPLPPSQHAVANGRECWSEHHSKLHSHPTNRQAVRGRPAGPVKPGGMRRTGWVGRSLNEVVEKLEKKGVDLHLKCQNWVTRSFS